MAYTGGMIIDFLIRFAADYTVILIIIIAAWSLIVYVPSDRRFAAYARILMAGLTAYMLARFVSTIYQPSTLRPFELLGVDPRALYLNNPGFPSDHALFVTAITCAVWFETRKKGISIILVLLTLLVCVGRVLAMVHTPLDVIGGVVIALIGATWYSNLPRKQEEHGNGQSHYERPSNRL